MNAQFEILEWDSQFFGKKIGHIINNDGTNGEIIRLLRELKNKNIDLIYYPASCQIEFLDEIVEFFNPFLADKKVTYTKKINENATVDESVVSYDEPFPSDSLIALAIESGEFSRFNVDERIPRQLFENLYKQWITNSVNRKIAQEVLVYKSNNKITGFITLGEKNGKADIGLVAVDSAHRGQGIGQALMQSSEAWAINNGYKDIQVVTQGNNKPACGLYKKSQYSIDKVQYIYHLWRK